MVLIHEGLIWTVLSMYCCDAPYYSGDFGGQRVNQHPGALCAIKLLPITLKPKIVCPVVVFVVVVVAAGELSCYFVFISLGGCDLILPAVHSFIQPLSFIHSFCMCSPTSISLHYTQRQTTPIITSATLEITSTSRIPESPNTHHIYSRHLFYRHG